METFICVRRESQWWLRAWGDLEGGCLPDSLALCPVLSDTDKVEEPVADITEQQELARQVSDAIPCSRVLEMVWMR